MAEPAILTAALLGCALTAQASDWCAAPMSPPPQVIMAETRAPAPDFPPDGRIATQQGGDIEAAWYSAPTTRYDHGIMGDKIEAGALNIRAHGRILTLTLPQDQVFEDQTPRIADLDGDGQAEVITIRTSLSLGAAVTIYGLKDGTVMQKASTAFIGRSHRWLNIAGIAPFMGAHTQEIAFVRTPHIGGTLVLIRYDKGVLSTLAQDFGYSNHQIGAREQRLSAVKYIDGTWMLALPSADRRALKMVRFRRDAPPQSVQHALPGRIDKAIAADEQGFIVGLDTGDILLVAPCA